jgi:hypothetical protein
LEDAIQAAGSESSTAKGKAASFADQQLPKWRRLSSGMLQRVVWWILTDVSEVLTASTIRAMCHHADYGGSKHSETSVNINQTT